MTGVQSAKVAATAQKPIQPEWSVDELKTGKPLMVYHFVELTDPTDDNYKFARKFEMGVLQQKVVDEINASWRATKRDVDIDADRKQEKNQARMEFFSFTGTSLGSVTLKNMDKALDGPTTFQVRLKDMEKQNRALCDAEIKRIQAEEQRVKSEASAAK